MKSFAEQHFAIVDLETTGTHPLKDRITEIGLIEVDGGTVTGSWSKLLNPQMIIPEQVQFITGIDHDLVKVAPLFDELADGLFSRLEGRILVAHNARFDYAFLKNSFKRLGYQYSPLVLCTVKLSKQLNPQFPAHKLDYLIEHYCLQCSNRHRAMDDAMVLWDLFGCWIKEHGIDRFSEAVSEVLKIGSLPEGLQPDALKKIPARPGVYFFYNNDDVLLYIGKSVNLKTRVRSHFSADHSNNREMEMSRQVTRVEFIRTAADTGAQLLESELIKKHQPIYNRRLRRTQRLAYFLLDKNDDGYFCLQLKSTESLPENPQGRVVGPFRSRRSAEAKLRDWAKSHQLCHVLTGLEKKSGKKNNSMSNGGCFAFQLKQCQGACCGKESAESYNARLMSVIDDWQVKAWPYSGPVVFEESANDMTQYHLVDQWCHLGTQDDISKLTLNDGQTYEFDYDAYKLLSKAFAQSSEQQVYLWRG